MKCKYCGNLFTKTHNRQVYCSDLCRKKALQDQKAKYQRKYYQKHREYFKNKKTIGTTNFKQHINTDENGELLIHKEIAEIESQLRKTGIKSITEYI